MIRSKQTYYFPDNSGRHFTKDAFRLDKTHHGDNGKPFFPKYFHLNETISYSTEMNYPVLCTFFIRGKENKMPRVLPNRRYAPNWKNFGFKVGAHVKLAIGVPQCSDAWSADFCWRFPNTSKPRFDGKLHWFTSLNVTQLWKNEARKTLLSGRKWDRSG